METFWILLGLIAGTLVSEDLTCVVAGGLIASGHLGWAAGVGACLLGILLGDAALYIAGRRLGRPALNRIPLRWMAGPADLERAEAWFARRGPITIFLARFLPGIRLPIYLAAGILRLPPRVFTTALIPGAVLWTPVLVGGSTLLAGHLLEGLEIFRTTAWLVLAALAPMVFLITRVLLPARSREGRRLLAGRWRRWRRPEYWPAPMFYVPVAAALLVRALGRKNRLLDFTCCNPCMPAGGIVGESKSAVLDRVGDASAVPPYTVFPETMGGDERMRGLDRWMEEARLSWPVVLKPDVGQRGHQVVVADTRPQAEETLRRARGRWIAQAHVPGPEFGVFMVRPPETGRWEIFDITLKTPTVVVGDGRRPLKELILLDSRAVCLAKTHFRALRSRLAEVPAPGERVVLSPLGNHCRGARFENGAHLATPALRNRMAAIADSIPGFHFGRFDIKAPDRDAFACGEGLRILEVNGVTSEATGLYDPENRYPAMAATLVRQWRIASHIGRANRERGQPPISWPDLIRVIDPHLRPNRHVTGISS